MSDCSFSPTLPKLLIKQQGEVFGISIDWSSDCIEDVEVTGVESEISRSPVDAPSIIVETSFADALSAISFAIADDQPVGEYHIRHVVTTSLGVTSVECFTILVEAC